MVPSTAPLTYERKAWKAGAACVVGLDEVGYGPLAGPVVVAAVVLHRNQRFEGATDSKLLSESRREQYAERIRREARAFALGAASAREIERLNARGAVSLAMRRALARLPLDPELILVDGLAVPDLPPHEAIVGGDRRSHSIACASIVAKVLRDRLMSRLDPRYPVYGWASNKGYRTAEHVAALREHGPTPHHRRTYAGVLQKEMELE